MVHDAKSGHPGGSLSCTDILVALFHEKMNLNLDENGMVDLNHLKSLMTDDTILVTIASVNSELGLLQPIPEIAKIVKEYPKCYFHSDMTQSVGKVNVCMDDVDFVSFSAHKFFGLKGIGCLLKNENIVIDPLIHGGKSTTTYRSGTPALPLIASLAKALRLAYTDFDTKYNHVLELNKYLKVPSQLVCDQINVTFADLIKLVIMNGLTYGK